MNDDVKLKPCPFCGGEPEIMRIGNECTKKRSIKIKCKKCRINVTNGAIYHSHEWLIDLSVRNWNKREGTD